VDHKNAMMGVPLLESNLAQSIGESSYGQELLAGTTKLSYIQTGEASREQVEGVHFSLLSCDYIIPDFFLCKGCGQ